MPHTVPGKFGTLRKIWEMEWLISRTLAVAPANKTEMGSDGQ